MYVKTKMTPKPLTVEPGLSILDASAMMQNNGVKRLPVTSGGKLIGIVTRSDIQQFSPSKATSLSVFELSYLLSKATIADAMTRNPITVDAGALVEEAAVIMRDNDVRALPVMENGELVGIITETDIFDAFIELIGFKDPGTRLVVRAKDAPGAMSQVTRVIGEKGYNISHISVFRGGNGMSDMVIRVNTDDVAPLVEAIRAEGYEIL